MSLAHPTPSEHADPPVGVQPAMRVSVVVMTFDRPASLRRCLASLASQTLARDAFEVVVVDVSTRPVGDVLGEFAASLRVIHHVGPNLERGGKPEHSRHYLRDAIALYPIRQERWPGRSSRRLLPHPAIHPGF